MKTDQAQGGPIAQEEIDAVNAKHQSIIRSSRKIFKDALELGDWFLEAQQRIGRWQRGGSGWEKWVTDNFQIHPASVRNYVRLARNRQFLEIKAAENRKSLAISEEVLPGIYEALRWIREKEEQEGSALARRKVIEIPAEATYESPNGHALPERALKVPPPIEERMRLADAGQKVEDPEEEPLMVLRGELKAYVIETYMLKRREAEILERIRLAKLTEKQIAQAIEWATQEHPEVKAEVRKVFLPE